MMSRQPLAASTTAHVQAHVASARIAGVGHEFPTIKGFTEDVTDIVLNLKGVVWRMHMDASEIEAPLVATAPGKITAGDFDLPAGVEVINPAAHVATLEDKSWLELYVTVGRGRGYRQAEDNRSADQPIGVIAIDSLFFRYSALTHLAEDNVQLPLLMAKSRYRRLRTLQRYARPGPDAVAALTAAHDPAHRR